MQNKLNVAIVMMVLVFSSCYKDTEQAKKDTIVINSSMTNKISVEQKVETPKIQKNFIVPQISDFKFVEGGTYTMGQPEEYFFDFPIWMERENDKQFFFPKGADEVAAFRPECTVPSFYMNKFEITKEQWDSFLQENLAEYEYETDTRFNTVFFENDRAAIQGVSWFNAVIYTNWVSEQLGLESCYEILENAVIWNTDKKGVRLPTESEWEFAARGGNKSKNYLFSGSNYVKDVGWYSGNYQSIISHEVGKLLPNELGIHDMSGNVAEWCFDDFFLESEKLPITTSETHRITEMIWNKKSLRGGLSGNDTDTLYLTPYMRKGIAGNINEAGSAIYGAGIRLVCDVEVMAKLLEASINDDKVRLRNVSNLDGEVLQLLNRGEAVKIIDRSNEKQKIEEMEAYWYKVELADGKTGWVYGAYVDVQ